MNSDPLWSFETYTTEDVDVYRIINMHPSSEYKSAHFGTSGINKAAMNKRDCRVFR